MNPVSSSPSAKTRLTPYYPPHPGAHAGSDSGFSKPRIHLGVQSGPVSASASFGFPGSEHLMNAYARYPVSIASGNGCRVTDASGRTYLDTIGGIACCPLGHAHPKFVESVRRHAEGLTNASNLFHTENAASLAALLCRHSGMDRAFFSNSGTEANEAAFKLAMAVTGKKRFIACEQAFHGRTLGSLAATFEPKYRAPFQPLMPAVDFVPYGDAASVPKAITPETAAVIVEPIQGESGVVVPPQDYLAELLELCESKDVLLIVDEVQTANGRTGTFFEWQSHEIKPHITTTAKGLANGLPIGVTLSRGDLDFKPGQHGTTFGGNSFVTGVAHDVVQTILNDGLMANAVKQGDRIQNAVRQMAKKSVSAVRGKGLMLGIQLDAAAKPAMAAMREQGVLCNVAHDAAIRLLPPLVLTQNEADEFLTAFNEAVS